MEISNVLEVLEGLSIVQTDLNFRVKVVNHVPNYY